MPLPRAAFGPREMGSECQKREEIQSNPDDSKPSLIRAQHSLSLFICSSSDDDDASAWPVSATLFSFCNFLFPASSPLALPLCPPPLLSFLSPSLPLPSARRRRHKSRPKRRPSRRPAARKRRRRRKQRRATSPRPRRRAVRPPHSLVGRTRARNRTFARNWRKGGGEGKIEGRAGVTTPFGYEGIATVIASR